MFLLPFQLLGDKKVEKANVFRAIFGWGILGEVLVSVVFSSFGMQNN